MDFSPTLLLLLMTLAVWWQARRCFNRQLSILRRQFDAQRAANSEFLEHANSQIDLLQSELALARRREDVLRARQASRTHDRTSARKRTVAPATALRSVICDQATVTFHRRAETHIAVCADKMHELPMLSARGGSNIDTEAQAA